MSRKNILLSVAGCLVLTCASLIAAQEPAPKKSGLKAEILSVAAKNELPRKLEFNEKPFSYNEEGVSLNFMVKGQGLVEVKRDSMKIESWQGKDGKNLKDSARQGPFAKITKQADLAFFVVENKKARIEDLTGMSIKGTVIVITATESTAIKQQMILSDTKQSTMGPFKISVTVEDKGMSLNVTGEITKISKLQVLDGNKKLESNGWSSFGNQKTFNYEKPTGTDLQVEIEYWEKITEEKVPFEWKI